MWELQVCTSLQAKDRKRYETVVWPSDWNHKESSALPTVSTVEFTERKLEMHILYIQEDLSI